MKLGLTPFLFAFVVFESLSQTKLVSDAGAWNGIANMEPGGGADGVSAANSRTPTKMALTIPKRKLRFNFITNPKTHSLK